MSTQDAVRQTTQEYFYWLYLLPLVSVGCYMLNGIFIGAGQTRLMLYLMVISVFCVSLPGWWVLSQHKNLGLWAAFTLFNLSRTTLMTVAYYFMSRLRRWI